VQTSVAAAALVRPWLLALVSKNVSKTCVNVRLGDAAAASVVADGEGFEQRQESQYFWGLPTHKEFLFTSVFTLARLPPYLQFHPWREGMQVHI
jgi:hypothetical protein